MNDSTNPMERIHHEQLRALLGRGMFSTVDAMLALDMHEPQGSRTMTALQAAGYIRSVERTADSPYVEQWATEADADLLLAQSQSDGGPAPQFRPCNHGNIQRIERSWPASHGSAVHPAHLPVDQLLLAELMLMNGAPIDTIAATTGISRDDLNIHLSIVPYIESAVPCTFDPSLAAMLVEAAGITPYDVFTSIDFKGRNDIEIVVTLSSPETRQKIASLSVHWDGNHFTGDINRIAEITTIIRAARCWAIGMHMRFPTVYANVSYLLTPYDLPERKPAAAILDLGAVSHAILPILKHYTPKRFPQTDTDDISIWTHIYNGQVNVDLTLTLRDREKETNIQVKDWPVLDHAIKHVKEQAAHLFEDGYVIRVYEYFDEIRTPA